MAVVIPFKKIPECLVRDRLTILEQYLRKGDLRHSMFIFSRWSSSGHCGSMGCAIGECPFVFPEYWEFVPGPNNTQYPVLKGTKFLPITSITHFFGLTLKEAAHLFNPNAQDCQQFGGAPLGNSATRIQVADNIKAFIAKRESNPPQVAKTTWKTRLRAALAK